MRFYHRTTLAAAESILSTGFRDATGSYLTDTDRSGVWVSDVPLDANEGAMGDVLLRLDCALAESFVDCWEWKEDGKTYREWLIPASVLNKYCTITITSEADEPNRFSDEPDRP